MQKLSFVVGAGVGYVLGTRSGRARYDQIVSGAQQVAQHPKVQAATETATTQALVLAGKASASAKSAAAVVQAKVSGGGYQEQPAKAAPDFGVAATYPESAPPEPGSAHAATPGVPDQHSE